MGTHTWVIVVSREHARRGVEGGFIMANHGKRGPLARMSSGDRILIYSPRTSHPDGESLKAITVVGTVTGPAPEPSPVIAGGFCLRARLQEVEPVPLHVLRGHLPLTRLRFGFFELPVADAAAIERLLT